MHKKSVPLDPETKRLMGVKERPEAKFEDKVISFLTSIINGFIIDFKYNSEGYSTKKYINDIFFWHHGETYALELKDEEGVLSKGQSARHEQMKRAGITVWPPLRERDFEIFKKEILRRCFV